MQNRDTLPPAVSDTEGQDPEREEPYRSVHPLSEEDEAEIDTFIMLRRMALLAWISSHIEAPEP